MVLKFSSRTGFTTKLKREKQNQNFAMMTATHNNNNNNNNNNNEFLYRIEKPISV